LLQHPDDEDGGLRSGVGVDAVNVAVGDLLRKIPRGGHQGPQLVVGATGDVPGYE
jgi:hypothetical protein